MSLNDALPRGITEQNKNMTDYERYLSGYEHGYDDQQLQVLNQDISIKKVQDLGIILIILI